MKLGFIALSGIRAENPALTELGLTMPGLVERNKIVAALPSLGLLTLAGMTPDNIEAAYVEVPDVQAHSSLPVEADVVAISSFSARIKDAYALADRYRSSGATVLMGGLHVSAMPLEALEHADSVVIGEGEPKWPQIVTDLQRGQLQRVYDARGTSFDLAKAVMPKYELLLPGAYNRVTIQTQRGCPFKCEFCAASILISPTYKLKPIDKVVAEVRRIKSLWQTVPFIEFADDNTFVNKSHSKKLLKALIPESIRWFTETDISVADDEELLELLRESGCAQVLVGFESVSAAGLDGLEMKTNWKAKQMDRYKRAIDRIQSHGITVNGCFILGLDGTGEESFEEVKKFVSESGLYEVQVTLQTVFPGTPLYERLKRENRLLRDDAWELCTLFDVNFQPQKMSVTELETGFRGLIEELYSADSTKKRKETYHQRRRAAHLLCPN